MKLSVRNLVSDFTKHLENIKLALFIRQVLLESFIAAILEISNVPIGFHPGIHELIFISAESSHLESCYGGDDVD